MEIHQKCTREEEEDPRESFFFLRFFFPVFMDEIFKDNVLIFMTDRLYVYAFSGH